MKRLALLALVAAFLFGTVNTASAMDDKAVWAQGFVNVYFQWMDNANFSKSKEDLGTNEDDFIASQRTRMYVDYMAGETVSAVIRFEIDTDWGSSPAKAGSPGGGGIGADGVNIETKNAYLQWTVPDSKLVLKMGMQGLSLPSATYGIPLLNDDVAAVVGNYQFNDMVSTTFFWTRLRDGTVGSDTSTSSTADEFDAVGIILPVSFDGGTFEPFFLMSTEGKDSYNARVAPATAPTDSVESWWLGGALKVTKYDPIFFGIDAVYGTQATDGSVNDANGWFAAAEVGYKMDMVTPSIVAFYGSGEDDDATNADGRMPIISTGNGAFAPTTFGTYGDWNMGSSNILTQGIGASGIGLKLADIALVENIKHEINLFYFKGTSDKQAATNFTGWANTNVFTTKDSAWEVNFESRYTIYENLMAVLDLSFVAPNFDDSIGARDGDVPDETAYKGCFQIQYSF